MFVYRVRNLFTSTVDYGLDIVNCMNHKHAMIPEEAGHGIM